MKLKKYSLTILFFCTSICSLFPQSNQLKSFSEDPIKFPQELKDFFEDNSGTNNKKEAKEFIEQFTLVWTTKFNDKYKQVTYKTCNLMLKKHLRPFPDFKNYLNSLVGLVNANRSDDVFNSWQSCVDKILNGKFIKNLSEYLSMSDNLFSSNTFYKSPVVEWSSNNNNYSFEYDSIPKVVFPSLTLRGNNSKGDSAVIYNTKGIYYPSQGRFIGNGGKVNWIKAGLEENVAYAELKRYEVILKTGLYNADSAVFYNKLYFGGKSLPGKVSDRVIAENGDKATYPRFESYSKRLQIKNLTENVDFDGGFSMRGEKFIGAGGKGEDANLIFKRNNKTFLIAASQAFDITKERISSDNVSIKMFLEKDSIVHPNLSLKFFVKERRLSLIRSDEGVSRSPFADSYHALDMYFENMEWKIDDPRIEMKMLVGSSLNEGDFESSNFFKAARYDQLQEMSETHPLVAIKSYIKSIGGVKEFYINDIAGYMKITPDQLRPLMVNLASMGFLIYDTDDDKIYVKDKLFDYTMARARKIDYDVISFHSQDVTNIASINLLNYDLTIRGVNSILMSDSQNVVIYPRPREIVVKKNRNFTFAGVVNAGRFEFFGKEFSFEYDKFKVNLTNVDSLRIKVTAKEPDGNGNYPLVRVKTVIEDINGELFIDNPGNKSGLKNFAQYPIFNSNKESFVYYDKKSIQGGKYPRDKVYFHLDPFTIDSLDNFTNAALAFNGEFISADIFPKFRETLKLQPDYSLGFMRSAPPEGYTLYNGKANFKNQINMSNQGLRGDGTIEYVTSTTRSNNFIFYPDSMNAYAQKFDIKEQTTKPEFPQVAGEDVYIHWMPYKDVMQITKKQKPILCYKNASQFSGTMSLTPQLLSGNGAMDFAGASLISKMMAFSQNKFHADTADFNLKSEQLADLSFATTNVNANVDFDRRVVECKSNGKGSVVKFPVNQYICFMDRFKWYMDKNEIELGSDKKVLASNASIDLDAPEFISIHPKQDSLRFYAPRAKYDTRNHIITALDVPYINVADARIFPDSGRVVIKKGAEMQTFTNAKILANTVTKHHNLYNVTANIFTRKSYAASGYYDYIDEIKNKQSIYFSNISVDTTFQTFAQTDVPDSVHFTLSPNYEYQGKVKLLASNEFLYFSGACRIQHVCDAVPRGWLKFSAEINPLEIYIPISKDLEGINGEPMAASVMLNNDSTHIYSAFLSRKKSKKDVEVMPSDGFLFFDKGSKEYRISNKEKLVERSIPGNYLSLSINKCIVYGEGKLNLGGDLGQIKMDAVGTVNHFLVPDSTAFDLMLLIDFFFDEGTMSKMAEAINSNADLKPTDFSRPVYEKGLRELMDKEKADKLISQINLYGSFKRFPDELEKAMFLTDVKMKWNSTTNSYRSMGNIGIGNLYKNQVNKFVNGKVELVKKKSGDILNIYFELDGNNWYFFTYNRGLMQAISSNDKFNAAIKELKPDKREMKTERGQPSYQFNLSTVNKKTMFLKKFDSNE